MYNSQQKKPDKVFAFELLTHVNLSGIRTLVESAILHTIKTVGAMCKRIGKHANNCLSPNETVQ